MSKRTINFTLPSWVQFESGVASTVGWMVSSFGMDTRLAYVATPEHVYVILDSVGVST